MRARIAASLAVLALSAALPAVAQARDAVERSLRDEASAGRLSPAQAASDVAAYRHAKRAVRRLHGPARANLGGVVRNTRALAVDGRLGAVRAQALLTVRRNLEWFWTQRRSTPRAGTRRTFEGSPVLFELYPGSGWQVQPLGNFGRLNALVKARDDSAARRLADDLLALRAPRGDALVLEYLFPWGDGGPGWVSGMATATGMQALARLAHRLHDDAYRDAAARMLPVFQAPPAVGVRQEIAPGRAHYLLYSQSPQVFVGNGFAQALIGLADYVRLSGDPAGQAVLDDGLRQARAGMSGYDTGAWSRYSRGGPESNLHYHELFATFLARLCARVGEQAFCAEAERFRAYERQPVALGDVRATLRHHRLVVRFRASKPGTATITALAHGRILRGRTLSVSSGGFAVRLSLPRRPAPTDVRIEARSLNGVASTVDAIPASHDKEPHS